MKSKPIIYKHNVTDDFPYKAEFYFHPLRLHIKLPVRLGKKLWDNWKW